MSKDSALEINAVSEVQGLVSRILSGEVLVLRQVLERVGILQTLVDASLKGIRDAAGDDTADKVKRNGFDRIHEWVTPGDIPALTDAVYKTMTPLGRSVLEKLVSGVFPEGGTYYYERSPNVRFHIPFDLAAQYRREYDKFAQKRGQGKIAAHGPHRDPWVDCPENAINVWIAVGPVLRGNGLVVFKKDYGTEFAFKNGYIEPGAKLHQPLTFELQPGDAVLFHSKHLHGSELNRTNRTRYVVSYRITFGKPYYPHGHYHHYLHAGLAAGPWRALAEVPQNLQKSFFRYQFRRLRYKITGRGKMSGRDETSAVLDPNPAPEPGADGSIALTDFPVGSIRAFSKTVCVARLAESKFATVSRHCTHSGGDLAGGWIDDGKIVCPLHSLPFDPKTGTSPCMSLRALRRYSSEVRGDRVYVLADGSNESEDSEVLVYSGDEE